MSALNAQLLAAHAADDRLALIKLYTQVAEQSADPQAVGFYLTNAYVYALEVGAPEAPNLRRLLVSMGCETAL